MTYCISGSWNDEVPVCTAGAHPLDHLIRIGGVTICLPREQLVAIRDAIQGYLDAHPAPFTPEEVEKIAAGIEAEDAREVMDHIATGKEPF